MPDSACKTIGIAQLRRRLGTLLKHVAKSYEPVVVKNHGTEVAAIVPMDALYRLWEYERRDAELRMEREPGMAELPDEDAALVPLSAVLSDEEPPAEEDAIEELSGRDDEQLFTRVAVKRRGMGVAGEPVVSGQTPPGIYQETEVEEAVAELQRAIAHFQDVAGAKLHPPEMESAMRPAFGRYRPLSYRKKDLRAESADD